MISNVSYYTNLISSKVPNELSLADAMDVVRSAMRIKRIKKGRFEEMVEAITVIELLFSLCQSGICTYVISYFIDDIPTCYFY